MREVCSVNSKSTGKDVYYDPGATTGENRKQSSHKVIRWSSKNSQITQSKAEKGEQRKTRD